MLTLTPTYIPSLLPCLAPRGGRLLHASGVPALRTARCGEGLSKNASRFTFSATITPPNSRKWLKINRRNSESRAMLASALPSRDGGRPKANNFGASLAGDHKARLCPPCGAQTCLVVCVGIPGRSPQTCGKEYGTPNYAPQSCGKEYGPPNYDFTRQTT